MLEFFSAGAAIAFSIIGFLLWRKQGFIEQLQLTTSQLETENSGFLQRIDVLENFCSSVSTVSTEYSSIIIIGPRASGKSSLVSLWCEVEKVISTHSPTINFNCYEFDLNSSEKTSFVDPQINVERIQIVEKKLRFYDYAGEDQMVTSAVERISESKNSTVVFVLNSDPGFMNDNRRYFSRALVEKINDAFNTSKTKVSNVSGAYVIFNKIDLTSNNSQGNYDSNLSELMSDFADCTANIESIFGTDVKYFATSARTNHNVLNLLQDIVRTYHGQ